MTMLCRHQVALRDDPEPSCGPTPVCSMWVTSETGTLHYGCAPSRDQGQATVDRFIQAGVAISGEVGPCCGSEDIACAFDTLGDDQTDEIVMLTYTLARAEGRAINVPYRCGCCGHMTYGGCCSSDGALPTVPDSSVISPETTEGEGR